MSDPCAPRRGLFVALCALDRVYRVSRAAPRHEKEVAARHDLAAGGPAANAAVTFTALGGRGALLTAEVLGAGGNGAYLLAATFGNMHRVYKPGSVELRLRILKQIQDTVGARVGAEQPFMLVFHIGSGCSLEEIRESLSHGVVSMNIDTSTQPAFTRAVADHLFTNYAGVLKIDGALGEKKAYDPRAYGKLAEAAMAARVVRACEDLGSVVTALAS